LSVVITGLSMGTSSVPIASRFIQPSATDSSTDFLTALRSVQNQSMTTSSHSPTAEPEAKESAASHCPDPTSDDAEGHKAHAGADAATGAELAGPVGLAAQIGAALLPASVADEAGAALAPRAASNTSMPASSGIEGGGKGEARPNQKVSRETSDDTSAILAPFGLPAALPGLPAANIPALGAPATGGHWMKAGPAAASEADVRGAPPAGADADGTALQGLAAKAALLMPRSTAPSAAGPRETRDPPGQGARATGPAQFTPVVGRAPAAVASSEPTATVPVRADPSGTAGSPVSSGVSDIRETLGADPPMALHNPPATAAPPSTQAPAPMPGNSVIQVKVQTADRQSDPVTVQDTAVTGPSARPESDERSAPAGHHRDSHSSTLAKDTADQTTISSGQAPAASLAMDGAQPTPPQAASVPLTAAASTRPEGTASASVLAAPASDLTTPSGAPTASPIGQIAPALLTLSRNSDGTQQIALRLQPEELGMVEVRIDRAPDGSARVSVTADNPDTLQMLTGAQSELHKALDAAGISTGRTLTFALVSDSRPLSGLPDLPSPSAVDDGSSRQQSASGGSGNASSQGSATSGNPGGNMAGGGPSGGASGESDNYSADGGQGWANYAPTFQTMADQAAADADIVTA